MFRSKGTIFSNEAILTQTDNFGERLESMINMIVNDLDSGTLDPKAVGTHPAIKQIELLTSDRLGMKVSLVTNENLAAILPFYSNKSHIFIDEIFRGNFNIPEQTALLRTFDQKKGTVNIEKAILTGIFSEYQHPVFLNIAELHRTYKLTSEEITGCLLHEYGHGFMACYFADRTDRTNQVLARIARKIQDRSEKGDIDYVFRELQTIDKDVTVAEVDKLLNGPRTVAGATWFRVIHRTVKSIMMDDVYNSTSFEQQSDIFASRFGYGRSLTMGLDKLHANTAETNSALLYVAEIADLIATIFMSLVVGAAIVGGGFVATFGTMFFYLIFINLHREDLTDYTYDKLKYRYLRIRQDLVDQLKTMKSTRTETQHVLDSIYDLDELVKKTKVINSIPSKVINAVFSAASKTQESIADQQLMEALASNDLYINAAELRTI